MSRRNAPGDPGPGGHARSGRSPAATTAWMCAANVLSMLSFSSYPALLPQLQAEWGLSNTEAGLVGGMLLGGFMVASPFLTSLTDRVDARRIFAVACLVTGLGAIGFALLAQGALTAAMLQALVGAGIAGTYMPGLRALTDQVGAGQSRPVSFYTASFGVGMAGSLFLTGTIDSHMGWQVAFAATALGPLAAIAIVLLLMPPKPRHGAARERHALLDFRPAFADRATRNYILGYMVHCWELFGSRAWLVAFLTFAQGRMDGVSDGSPAQGLSALAPEAWLLGPVAIAALANLFAPPASVFGNELALRHGRAAVIRVAMAASGALTCVLGFLSGAHWLLLAALVFVQMLLVNGDSATLTAGVVAAADERRRGLVLAAHSTLGFGMGFVSPLVFGVVLDLAGGNRDPMAWGAAFVSLGLGGVVMSRIVARGVSR